MQSRPPPTPSLGALRRPGVQVYAWGRSDLGELGIGAGAAGAAAAAAGFEAGDGCVLGPVIVESVWGRDVTFVAAAAFNSAFVTSDGEVLMCGANDSGQLGTKQSTQVEGAARVEALDVYKIIHAAVGQSHTLAVTDQGSLASWGTGEFGQLGTGAESGEQSHPRIVRGSKELRLTRVAAGSSHSLGLSSSGAVYSWGQGTFGALGHDDEDSCPAPRLIQRLWPLGVVQVSCGENHSGALTVDGRLLLWGRNKYGQLGSGDFKNSLVPQRVMALQGTPLVQVACGGNHTLALCSSGQVYSWGQGTWGQLGLGSQDNTCRPNVVQALQGHRVVQLAAGLRHSAALCSDNSVLTWGANDQGQLGQGHQLGCDRLLSPLRLPPKALPDLPVLFIAAGGDHTMAVLKGRSGEEAPGEQVWVGPIPSTLRLPPSSPATPGGPGSQLSRPHGAGCMPIALPNLLELAAEVAQQEEQGDGGGDGAPGVMPPSSYPSPLRPRPPPSPTAEAPAPKRPHGLDGNGHGSGSSSNSPSPRRGPPPPGHAQVHRLLHAVEDVFSSPGFLAAGFAAPGDTQQGEGNKSSPASSDWAVLQELLSSMGMPWHGMDTGAITAVYQALLRVYSSEVISTLGTASYRLLETLDLLLASSMRAKQPAGHNSPSAASGPGSWLEHQMVLPALFVLIQSPLNGEALALGSSGVLAGGSPGSRVIRGPGQPLSPGSGGGGASSFPLRRNTLDPGDGSPSSQPHSLMGLLINCWLRLAPAAQQVLAHWVASLPPDIFGGRVLRPLQRHITRCAQRGISATRHQMLQAAQVMYQLHDAQEALLAKASEVAGVRVFPTPPALSAAGVTTPLLLGGPPGRGAPLARRDGTPLVARTPLSEWHNAALSEALNLKEEYIIYAQLARSGRIPRVAAFDSTWGAQGKTQGQQSMGLDPVTTICQVPLLLTPDAKSRILQGEAAVQKQHVVQSSAMNAMMQGLHPQTVVFLDIHVRRDHLLHDCLEQILRRPEDLKKPLRVTFIGAGGVAEEGVDEGGVSREFFQLLVLEIFRPEYGMFSYDEESRAHWFSPISLESDLEFQLVGAVLGLAIYNGVILDLHFPLVTYKKLLGLSPQPEDLAEVSPSLARGLQQLLDFEGDVEATFCRSFEVELDFFGTTQRVELMPGGGSVAVTAANREEYVKLYTNWLLSKSIQKQFNAFAHGFHQVCGGLALSLFTPEELELLVAGLPHLDFEAMRQAARYEGYSPDSRTIQDFWSLVQAMDMTQKRKFLSFCTGCDRAPVGGLGKLTLTIQRSGPDSSRLPTAHTCFTVLLLPEYASKEKLKEKLLTAIENAQGFGLK